MSVFHLDWVGVCVTNGKVPPPQKKHTHTFQFISGLYFQFRNIYYQFHPRGHFFEANGLLPLHYNKLVLFPVTSAIHKTSHCLTYKWRNEGPELRWSSTRGNMCEWGPPQGWWGHPNSRQGACSSRALWWSSWASRAHAHPLSSTRDQTVPTANRIST